MKQIPFILFFTIILTCIVSHQTVAQSNCETSSEAVLFNDSIKLALRVIQKPLVVTDSSCKTFVVQFNQSKKKFQDVYDFRFYHQSDSETTLKVSFFSNSNWSKEVIIKTSGRGYRTHSFSVLNNVTNIDSLDIRKMKIVINSESSALIDELEFRYFETVVTPNVRGLTKKRQEEISDEIEKVSRKERKARKKDEMRRNKEIYGTEGQRGN